MKNEEHFCWPFAFLSIYFQKDCNEDKESNFDQYASGKEHMNSSGNINAHNKHILDKATSIFLAFGSM